MTSTLSAKPFHLASNAGDRTKGQFCNDVGFGDKTYLVLWRLGLANRNAELIATRIDKNGQTLDPNGIKLNMDIAFPLHARVAFGKNIFLVVFSGLKEQKITGKLAQSGIFGIRIKRDGTVLDKKPFTIGDAPGHQAEPDIAFDGRDFRVVWKALLEEDTWEDEFCGLQVKGLYEIRTARVHPSGQLVDKGPGILAARGPLNRQWQAFGACYHPTISCAGTRIMIAFSYASTYPQAIIFDASQPGPFSPEDENERIDLPQIIRKVGPLSGRNINPAVAGSSKVFLASWSVKRERGNDGPPWTAMIFDLTGRPIDKNQKGISPASGGNLACIKPALSFDGYDFVWAWINHKTQKLYVNRISEDGICLLNSDIVLEKMIKDKKGKYLPRNFSEPHLASDGRGKTLCVYTKYATQPTERVQVVGEWIIR